MKAYRFSFWPGSLRPKHPDQSTICDGGIFRIVNEAVRLRRHVLATGGQLCGGLEQIDNASTWWESLEEYLGAGTLTTDELHVIGQRRASTPNADLKP